MKREGQRKIHKAAVCQIKSIDEANHRLTVLVSVPTVDRHNEMVLATAYAKHLPGYLANPMFLMGHDWDGGTETVMGQAIDAQVLADEGLEVTFQFDMFNPKAALAWEQVKAGSLRAFSVGFYSLKRVTRGSPESEKAALPPYARAALDAGARCIHTEVELVEVSIVKIPSCREALLAASADGRMPSTKTHPLMMDIIMRLHGLARCLDEIYSWENYDSLDLPSLERLEGCKLVLEGVAAAIGQMVELVLSQQGALANAAPNAAPETTETEPEPPVLEADPADEQRRRAAAALLLALSLN